MALRLPRGLAARLSIVVCLAACVTHPDNARAAQQRPSPAITTPAALVYRVFLKDGSSIVVAGEPAEVGDRIVVPIPLGNAATPTGVQIVSVPLDRVDQVRTRDYAEAVRSQHYAATAGEADYAALVDSVARALTLIARTPDAAARRDLARQGRNTLAAWQRLHYGYRARDIAEHMLLFDEALSTAQAELGERRFAFDLVATTLAPAATLLEPPSLQDTIESAAAAARLVDNPDERLTLQQAILAVLERGVPGTLRRWRVGLTRELRRLVRQGVRDTAAYRQLREHALRRAATFVESGDVEGLEVLLADVSSRDARLGHRRPDDVAGLLLTLDTHVAEARRRRLELDRWRYRHETFAAYRDRIQSIIQGFSAVQPGLTAIRRMAGPDPIRLRGYATALQGLQADVERLVPPLELSDTHATLLSAATLAADAIRLRLDAIRAADSQLAFNASAAAAGASLLVERTSTQIESFFRKPGSR